MGNREIRGWASGTGMDSEDTLNFSALTGVKPKIETYPLEKAPEAFDRMDERQGALPGGDYDWSRRLLPFRPAHKPSR
jgi:D-arabinose 1-dehydrogenase-like Zn-dependent alcohol dehydrogenase